MPPLYPAVAQSNDDATVHRHQIRPVSLTPLDVVGIVVRRVRPMHAFRTIGPVLAAVILVAACGGSAGSTGATATQGATATDEGAAGTGTPNGGADFSHGKAHFDLTGAATQSGDLGLDVVSSQFEIDNDDSAVLVFLDPTGTGGLTINTGPNGSIVQLAGAQYSVVLLPINGVVGTCTVTTTDLDGDSAKGTFSCEHVTVVQTGGTILGEGALNGTFDAHS
jgi:hypothetical protein